MKLHSLPAVLLLVGLGLAPWLGGRILVEAEAVDPQAWLYETLISRMSPAAGHAVVGAFLIVAFVVATLQKYVLQLPAPRLLLCLLGLWAWIALSTVKSEFHHLSLMEFAAWTVYVVTAISCTMIFGRLRMARTALLVMFAATAFVALSGIWEFASSVRSEPSHRIFAGWMNPNAAAGLFAMVLPSGVALIAATRGGTERLLLALCAALCACALWLTASKGGLASAALGVTALVALFHVKKLFSRSLLSSLTTVVAVAALMGLFVTVVGRLASPGNDALPTARILAAGQEAEQSFGFRKRLWAETARMASANPVLGVGIGAYWPELKPYTATQGSRLAHNSYLQVAAECGFPALALLVLFGFYWVAAVMKAHPAAPDETTILRMGVAASVFSAGANALVESSLSYFGFSVLLFAFLGIGLLLSADGVMPERAPILSRTLVAVAVSFGVFYWLGGGALAGFQLSAGLHALSRGDAERSIGHFEKAKRLTPADPQAYTNLAKAFAALGRHESAIRELETSVTLGPAPGAWALLADALAAVGKSRDAERAYERAIQLHPASPLWMRRYFEFLRDTNQEQKARSAALSLVQMEQSDYFLVTALPQFVNTDTVSAREFLAYQARDEGDQGREISLLAGAYRILVEYRRRTYAELMRYTGGDPQYDDVVFAGESVTKSRAWFEKLEYTGKRLAALYRRTGQPDRAKRIEEEIQELRAL